MAPWILFVAEVALSLALIAALLAFATRGGRSGPPGPGNDEPSGDAERGT